jgi:hypothetical protein
MKQTLMQRSLPKASTPAAPKTPRSASSVNSCTSGVITDDVKSADIRFCGDLSKVCAHDNSIIHLPLQKKCVCAVCGERCRHLCAICAMHCPSFANKDGKTVPCFLHHHNMNYFGLAMEDHKLIQKKRKKFEVPDDDHIKEHSLTMSRMQVVPRSPIPHLQQPLAQNTTTATPTSDRHLTPNCDTVRMNDEEWNENCL